ncbi:MAG: helix-turn-helix domain-containing protein [Spirochaetota bacterium]
MEQKSGKTNCSHLALMVDQSYAIQHVSYSQEACPEEQRSELLGRQCHAALWNLPQPCGQCPIEAGSIETEGPIASHFQFGITPILEGMISETLIPLSDHGAAAYIVLVEPLVESLSDESNASSLLFPSFENYEQGSKERSYLLHLHYHRLFYHHFYEYGLTHTEQEVALFILQGLSSKEIADRLFISKKSVDFHRHNIRKKLGLIGKRLSIANFMQSLVQIPE